MLAGTVVAGHPVVGAAGMALASALVLPLVDFVGLGSLAWRGRVQDRPAGAVGRALRRSARQARKAAGARPGVIRAMRGALWARPAQFPFLPRPARWALHVMPWPTALVTARIIGQVVASGFPAWQGTTTRGQQILAWTWMMHLVIWCQIACRRLNRSRAAAGVLTRGRVASP